MDTTTQSVPPTSSVDASKINEKPQKRKGPKPSSKKRLEKFRLEKSKETMAEIHRAAMERTSVSLDALLKTLSDMQIIAQKQEVVVPITTRGVGFLSNESFEEAKLQCPKAARDCDVHSVYRVSMSQLQHQCDISDVNRDLADPIVEQLDTQNPRMPPEFHHQVASCPQNFSLVSELINSVGQFEHAQTKFRPEIAESGPVSVPLETPKRRRPVGVLVPDPFTVTFKNLRSTVEALSDPHVPVDARRYFIQNNPIPGARFADDLLLNADDIIPAHYGVDGLARDQRRLRAMIERLSPKCSHLVGKCNFAGKGSPAQLVTVYKEQFHIEPGPGNSNLLRFPTQEMRFRCIRQLEPGFIVRGAISLLGEYPSRGTDPRLYGIREPPHHESYFDVGWGMLVHKAFSR